MKINTKFFEEIEIEEKEIINFTMGLPGFEDYKQFAILDIENNKILKCLQSINNSDVCLLIASPWEIRKDYEIELSDEEISEMDIKNEKDVAAYSVLTFRDEKITANLVAPIIINLINKKAKQIILPNTKYEIRQEISCLY